MSLFSKFCAFIQGEPDILIPTVKGIYRGKLKDKPIMEPSIALKTNNIKFAYCGSDLVLPTTIKTPPDNVLHFTGVGPIVSGGNLCATGQSHSVSGCFSLSGSVLSGFYEPIVKYSHIDLD